MPFRRGAATRFSCGRTVDTVTFHPAMLVDGHVRRKCPSVVALTRTKILFFRMRHGTARPTRNRLLTVSRPLERCRPRPPSVRIFFPSPAPTSKRWVITPCHRSAPVFALRSAFIAAFSTFARTLSPTLSFSELVEAPCACAVVKHGGNLKKS